MWYVIQTVSGEEDELKKWIEKTGDAEKLHRCFIPLFEDVRRSGGKSNIYFRRLFPGYVFVDTDAPEYLLDLLRRIPRYTRLLGLDKEKTEAEAKYICAIEGEDQAFLESLFAEGIMRVSYVQQVNGKRIGRVIGPLAGYRNHITKIDFRHRMAIVEAEMFGRHRKVKFGLWTDEDPQIPWIMEQLRNGKTAPLILKGIDIGIRPGDKVVCEDDIYEENIFVVEKVDGTKRIIYSHMCMGEQVIPIRFYADRVKKIGE